ncbi:5-formyltetrahydrofolate cyclo-ligase [Butyrivibrio proteoclasticus]|uniref:5-formyltetrahydrofolate cyclo-ligase n=1 Tax=Butyrivibrio proteoclasticus TaxID=43305 RepID=A0A1I5QFW6_9FIRM|nr:5-formyltetrahydrofolate cyclo-ligase [Butyrivibrio proteoclasticus]SFP44756.1 5-formyltetrahydrofolate cyclo-ligase [Butyrivibrio proteoclasticus]
MQKETADKKDRIRKEVLEKRNLLSVEAIEEKSSLIAEKLFGLKEYVDAENILIYASMKSEVITDGIIEHSLESGKKVFCPKCTDKNNGLMEFIQIEMLSDLKAGYMGIREPEINESSKIFLGPTEKTLVIIPGVAFDKKGNRIGYRGGYYDRFLSKYNGIMSVALAFTEQIIEVVPSEIHDIPVDMVLNA